MINLKTDEENYKIILMGIEEELNKLREILIWKEWLMKNIIPSKMNLPFYHMLTTQNINEAHAKYIYERFWSFFFKEEK